MPSPAYRQETLTYRATRDGLTPLYADVGWLADGCPKPILAVMHGYGGDRRHVAADVRALAAQGVVAVAPDMRGGGDSAGAFDSGGWDVHDIVDALVATCRHLPGDVQPANWSIVGYSGGGGNALSAAVRFPDRFHVAVSFFGVTDYAGFYRAKGREDCNARMVAALGGTPDELPDVYAARNIIPAAGNTGVCRYHLFWDSEEKQCPPALVEAFIAEYRRQGHANLTPHISRPGDAQRWIHGYRTSVPDLYRADALFLPDVLIPRNNPPALPPRGTLTVCGYLVTRAFQVVIEDGQRGMVRIAYDLTTDPVTVRVTENARDYRVSVTPASPVGDGPPSGRSAKDAPHRPPPH